MTTDADLEFQKQCELTTVEFNKADDIALKISEFLSSNKPSFLCTAFVLSKLDLWCEDHVPDWTKLRDEARAVTERVREQDDDSKGRLQ